MSHIFISYSRKDSKLVEKIVDALTEDDLKPWLDWKSIPKGEEVQREIHRAIEKADIFLFFVSPDSIQSRWCIDEIEHAAQNNKRILPIVIRDTDKDLIHPEINKRNWIFCRDTQDNFNKAVEEMRKTIHTDYEWLKYHTELQVKALKWGQKRDASRLLRGKELQEAKKQLAEVSSQKEPQPTSIQHEYILASSVQGKRARTLMTVGFLLATLIITVSVFISLFYKDQTEQQAEIVGSQQRLAKSQELADESTILLNRFPDRSTLLAIEAVKLTLDARDAVAPESAEALRNSIGNLGVKVLNGDVSSNSFSDNSPIADILEGHTSYISDVEFSPDGEWFASSDSNDTVFLWSIDSSGDPKNNVKLNIANTPRNIIRQLSFSPDSRWLAAASDYGIHLLDLTSSNLAFLNMSQEFGFLSVTFSSDNRFLVAGGDSIALVWNLISTSPLPIELIITESESVWTLAISPDNKWLAAGSQSNSLFSENQGSIYLWQLSDLKLTPVILEVPDGKIKSLAFSPNGQWLASASFEIRLWNMSTMGSTFVTLTKQPTIAYKLLFSPDGKWLAASFSNHDYLTLWDMSTSNFSSTNLVGHTKDIFDLAFSADSKTLASASLDKDIRVWNLLSPVKSSAVLKGNEAEVLSVTFSPSGQRLASGGSDAKIRFWPFESPSVFTPEEDIISSLAICQVDSRIAANYIDGEIKIWEVDGETEAPVVLDSSVNPMISMSFSPNCNWLVGQSKTEGVYIWNLLNPLLPPVSHKNESMQIPYFAFSPDEMYLAVAQANGNIKLWTLNNLDLVPLAIGKNYGDITGVEFSGDGRWLLWGEISGDQFLLLAWDSTSPNSSPIILRDFDIPQQFIINRNGNWVATLSYKEANVWFLDETFENLTGLTAYDPYAHETNPFTSFSFSPNGQALATGMENGQVNITSLLSLKTYALSGHTNIIYSIAFSHNEKWLATGSGDNVVRLWNLHSGNAEALSGYADNIIDVGFTANDRWLVTRSRDSKIVLWLADINEVINIACGKVGRNFTPDEWSQYFPGESYRVTCVNWPSQVNLEAQQGNEEVFKEMDSWFFRIELMIILVILLFIVTLCFIIFFVLRKLTRHFYVRYRGSKTKNR